MSPLHISQPRKRVDAKNIEPPRVHSRHEGVYEPSGSFKTEAPLGELA